MSKPLFWSMVALSLGCNDVLVEDVPPETCLSGKRWIGGDRGSPNMYPGRDCVGCHKDNDAPELVLGGTVYDTLTPEAENCFGAEGVLVRVTSGDGQIYETYSNESGNFWFSARDYDFAVPFQSVQLLARNRLSGGVEAPQMFTQGGYGGCARCHGAEQPGEQEAGPGEPDYVIPVDPIGIPAQNYEMLLETRVAGGDWPSLRFSEEEEAEQGF